MMQRNEIEEKVVNLLKEILHQNDIQLETPLLGRQGIMDSVTVVRLVQQLEKEFNLSFDDDLELESLASAGTVVELIKLANNPILNK